jgi:hypothetical protein
VLQLHRNPAASLHFEGDPVHRTPREIIYCM